MAENRIEQCFQGRLSAKGHALLPYFTAGFPDDAITAQLIRRADAMGVVAIEIGIPYSDSIADGPVIQSSFNHVLQHGHTVDDTFDLVSHVRPSVTCGLLAMVSYSVVHRVVPVRFMARAATAGFDGVILPDLPVEEAGPSVAAAHGAGLCHIGLVVPATSPVRSEAIAGTSSGFIYKVAVAGTTGATGGLSASAFTRAGT